MLQAGIAPHFSSASSETDLAVRYACRDFGENFQLLDRKVALAGPRTDDRIEIKVQDLKFA